MNIDHSPRAVEADRLATIRAIAIALQVRCPTHHASGPGVPCGQRHQARDTADEYWIVCDMRVRVAGHRLGIPGLATTYIGAPATDVLAALLQLLQEAEQHEDH